MNLVNDCVKWLENLADQYGVNVVETDKLPPTAPSASYKAKKTNYPKSKHKKLFSL